MHEFHLDTIGTHLHITIDSSSPTGEDFSQIQKRLEKFEEKFSRFIDKNWLSKLNFSRSANLDADGEIMLSYMLYLAKQTGGYFDPTISKILRELGYANKELTYSYPDNTTGYGDYRDIEIRDNQVFLHGNIELEFGGIGKGYMLTWIAKFLSKHDRYLIDFGGDLFGKGSWKIGLENPYSLDEIIGTYILDGKYLACSSGVKRRWGNHHHLINPHTRQSSSDVLASYIEARDGMVADGYATTLCVMSWELAKETLEKTTEIVGILVSKSGEIYQSKGSESVLFS